MLLCARWLLTLPIQSQRFIVSSTKSKIFSQTLVGGQYHSCLLFQHLSLHGICACSLKELNENNFVLSTQFDSSYSNTSLTLNSGHSPYVYRCNLIKFYCSSAPEPEKKLSLFQRFKKMYKDYWYILVPVHLITSAFWFSSFYYLTKSGVDIAGVLESIGAGEKLVQKLRSGNSTMGYLAISYALYKIATPVRYTVTLGGTTLSIKYLRDWGYIKPIPPKDKIKEMIHEKKDIFLERRENLKNRYKEQGLFEKILSKIGFKKNRKDKD